jgi:hypothetical protein
MQSQESLNSRNVWCLGVGVVMGGMLFVGETQAQLISESFESTPSSLFGAFNSYAYSQNYTSPNIPPGAGLRYYTGDAAATTTHAATVDITDAGGGLATATIDGGLGTFSLSAYFTTYRSQNDWSSVTVQFLDGSSADLGAPVVIGGLDFVSTLPLGPGTNYPDEKDWGQDLETGAIPVGARSAEVTILTTRLAGSAGDGYMDLLQFNVAVVPEPEEYAAIFGLGALAGAHLWRRRNRR